MRICIYTNSVENKLELRSTLVSYGDNKRDNFNKPHSFLILVLNARIIHMAYFKMLKKTNGGAINQKSAAPIYPASITSG